MLSLDHDLAPPETVSIVEGVSSGPNSGSRIVCVGGHLRRSSDVTLDASRERAARVVLD
jgi:hypothetical protein